MLYVQPPSLIAGSSVWSKQSSFVGKNINLNIYGDGVRTLLTHTVMARIFSREESPLTMNSLRMFWPNMNNFMTWVRLLFRRDINNVVVTTSGWGWWLAAGGPGMVYRMEEPSETRSWTCRRYDMKWYERNFGSEVPSLFLLFSEDWISLYKIPIKDMAGGGYQNQ